MTLKEVSALGYKEVIVEASGYQEVGILECWQPFRNIRQIVFNIEFFQKEPYLENPTFWLDDENSEDYYIEEDKVVCYEPNLLFSMADYLTLL